MKNPIKQSKIDLVELKNDIKLGLLTAEQHHDDSIIIRDTVTGESVAIPIRPLHLIYPGV